MFSVVPYCTLLIYAKVQNYETDSTVHWKPVFDCLVVALYEHFDIVCFRHHTEAGWMISGIGVLSTCSVLGTWSEWTLNIEQWTSLLFFASKPCLPLYYCLNPDLNLETLPASSLLFESWSSPWNPTCVSIFKRFPSSFWMISSRPGFTTITRLYKKMRRILFKCLNENDSQPGLPTVTRMYKRMTRSLALKLCKVCFGDVLIFYMASQICHWEIF